jgi:hypothetical protein
MTAEAGHQPGRAYIGQDGNLHLNGGKLLDVFENDITDQLTMWSITTIAAAGSNQGNAAALALGRNNVTGADGAKGVISPTIPIGEKCFVTNQGSGVLNIYPPAGVSIDGSAPNVAVTLAAGFQTAVRFVDRLTYATQ